MLKLRRAAPPVLNVVGGQIATLDLNKGPRYHAVKLIATVTKSAATSGYTSPTLADVLGLINIKVDTQSRRQHTATEMDAIQTAWDVKCAAVKYDDIANDLVTAAAYVTWTTQASHVVANGTQRTTNWVFYINFAEPARESYTAREAFAWPTAWKSGKTAAVQLEIGVPNNSVAATSLFENWVIRAEEIIDFATGPVINGKDAMPLNHFYRQLETYSGTTPSIRKWPYEGSLLQVSIFNNEADYITGFEVKRDDVGICKGTKYGNDRDNVRCGWYSTGISAGRLDLAFDFDDDPMNGLPVAQANVLELNLTLAAAAATNKTLTLINQVIRDALA
jgi:hypothetical protein